MDLTSKRILIIDDDDVLRTLLGRTLNTVGCDVLSSDSIAQAMELLKTAKPDLIILDLNMPSMNGFTFLKFRHLNKILSGIPIIVLSGTKNQSLINKALEMGADQFLEKPFESRIILQKIKYILHSQENFTYHFEHNELPSVEAEVQGSIIQHSLGHLKIESQVKFCTNKSVEVISKDYLKNDGGPIVCKINDTLAELNDGFYRTVFEVMGLDNKRKKQFDEWQRSLTS